MSPFLPLIVLLVLTLTVVPPVAATEQRREAYYSIHAKGMHVGDLQIVTAPFNREGERVFRFHSTTRIDAAFLFFGVKSQRAEEAVIGESGTLRYQRSGTENGRKTSVSGEYDGDAFTLRITEGDSRRAEVFKRGSYDFTTMDCPEMTLKQEGEQVTVRLLDLEDCRVVTRRYHWVKSEDLRIGERTVRCRVIDFEDQANRCRRWVMRDELGILIVRQEGRGTSGGYTLKIASLSR